MSNQRTWRAHPYFWQPSRKTCPNPFLHADTAPSAVVHVSTAYVSHPNSSENGASMPIMEARGDTDAASSRPKCDYHKLRERIEGMSMNQVHLWIFLCALIRLYEASISQIMCPPALRTAWYCTLCTARCVLPGTERCVLPGTERCVLPSTLSAAYCPGPSTPFTF